MNVEAKREQRGKTFVRWFNAQFLLHYGPKARLIKDLTCDFRDGVFLINVADAVFHLDAPSGFVHKAESDAVRENNVLLAFSALSRLGIRADWFSAQEIVRGDADATLNLCWLLVAHGGIVPHLPVPPKQESLAAFTNDVAGQVVAWVRRRIAAHPMIIVKDLGAKSFGDGMALCAIVSALDPNALSFANDVVPGVAEHNIGLALDGAVDVLGLPRLLDVSDFTAPGPDDACVMTVIGGLLAWYRGKFGKPGQTPVVPPPLDGHMKKSSQVGAMTSSVSTPSGTPTGTPSGSPAVMRRSHALGNLAPALPPDLVPPSVAPTSPTKRTSSGDWDKSGRSSPLSFRKKMVSAFSGRRKKEQKEQKELSQESSGVLVAKPGTSVLECASCGAVSKPDAAKCHGCGVHLAHVIDASNMTLAQNESSGSIRITSSSSLLSSDSMSTMSDVDVQDLSMSTLTLSSTTTTSTTSLASDDMWDIPFEDLHLESELGRGAFGVVYKATWRLQDVAVKQLLTSKDRKGKRYRELLQECRLMMGLRPHHNVVQLLGVSASPDSPLCVVTALAPLGSLRDLLNDPKQSLKWEEVLQLLMGIGAGVHHLHLEKILHRDLAARNVLLSAGLEPQITDFGLSAKVLDTEDHRQSAFFRGPYKHMAPESLLDNSFSTKSDAWSFGVLAWELCCRGEPHPRVNIYEAARLIRKGATPSPLRNTPSTIQRLFDGCWQIDPKERTSIEQTVLALRATSASKCAGWTKWPLLIKKQVHSTMQSGSSATMD